LIRLLGEDRLEILYFAPRLEVVLNEHCFCSSPFTEVATTEFNRFFQVFCLWYFIFTSIYRPLVSVEHQCLRLGIVFGFFRGLLLFHWLRYLLIHSHRSLVAQNLLYLFNSNVIRLVRVPSVVFLISKEVFLCTLHIVILDQRVIVVARSSRLYAS